MRCFVGLWPDALARSELAKLGSKLHAHCSGARLAAAENLHMTVAFIGELDNRAALALTQALATVKLRDAVWQVDTVGAFDRAHIIWAGGTPTAPLAKMVDETRALLDSLRISFDRKAFAAHVTLLRNAPRACARTACGPIIPPIRWQLAGPVLIASASNLAGGVNYRTVDSDESGRVE